MKYAIENFGTMKKSFILIVIGFALGAFSVAMFVRNSNSKWIIRPALISGESKNRQSQYLIQGVGWSLPLIIKKDTEELRMIFPSKNKSSIHQSVNIYLNQEGVRSVSVANSDQHGATVSKSKKSTGLFDEMIVHTPSLTERKVLVKVDIGIDGIFESAIETDK